MKKTISLFLPLLLGCHFGARGESTENLASQTPHIIILFVDDMGYGDIGSYNLESKIPSPKYGNWNEVVSWMKEKLINR